MTDNTNKAFDQITRKAKRLSYGMVVYYLTDGNVRCSCVSGWHDRGRGVVALINGDLVIKEDLRVK